MKLLHMAQELVSLGDEFLKKHGPLEFHEVAYRLLNEAKLHENFSLNELVLTTMNTQFKVRQNFNSFDFSDLPVTLAFGEHCFLDIYCWRRRPTVIHNHHFTGAFQCLQGLNQDLEFEFSPSRMLGEFHQEGTLKLKNVRELKTGEIVKIHHLDDFIHQNHHQADLTINVCFRTPDIGDEYLSEYLFSGLRMCKNKSFLNRTKRLQNFLFLDNIDLNQLDLNLDDAIYFLVHNVNSKSLSPRLHEMLQLMDHKVQKNFGLDIKKMVQNHEDKLVEFEDEYH